MTPLTCGNCHCFRQYYGEKIGDCWGAMPGVQPNGFALNEKPNRVRADRVCCASIVPLPAGEPPIVKGKASPETVGDAVKQAAALKKQQPAKTPKVAAAPVA